MRRIRPISLNVVPDEDLEAANCAQIVISAYTAAMVLGRDERQALEAATRAWRERNLYASPEEGPPAVAVIIAHRDGARVVLDGNSGFPFNKQIPGSREAWR